MWGVALCCARGTGGGTSRASTGRVEILLVLLGGRWMRRLVVRRRWGRAFGEEGEDGDSGVSRWWWLRL